MIPQRTWVALTVQLVLLFCALLASRLPAGASAPRAVTVSLTVTERAGAARSGWPVISGVPFARSVLAEEDVCNGRYRVVDAVGNEVPSQATVTALWGRHPQGPDGSVRWVRLVFLADVPPNGSARFRLEVGPGITNTSSALLPPGAGLKDAAAAAELQRGEEIPVLDFGPPRVPLLPPTGDQMRLSYLHQGKRHQVDMDAVAWRVEAERVGAVETVFKAAGKLDERMELLVRVYAYVGWPALRVQPTLIYRGDPSKKADWVELEEFSYSLPLAPVGRRRGMSAFFGTGEAYGNGPGGMVEVPVGGRATAALEQDIVHRFQRDHTGADGLCRSFGYEVRGGSPAPLAQGSRAPGWVLVRDNERSVFAWCRYFWQLFPKRIRVDGAHITCELWAKGAEFEPRGCQRFYKGMAKTHDLFFRFDAKPLSAKEAQGFARALGEELVAACEPEYYCATGAYGPHRLSPAVIEGKRLHPDYDELVRWCLNRELTSSMGLYPWRERQDTYGLLNFGDWLLDTYWASHEYDTIWAFLAQFYRTGELELLDYVREAARHSYDIDFHHNYDLASSGYPQTSHDKTNHHFQGGDSHGHTDEADPGHVFIDGLLNYYWLTGDLRAGDVLDWAFPLYLVEQKERLCGGGTWRYVGGYVVGIYVRGYEWTWDPAYIEQAEWAVASNFYPDQPGRGNSTRHSSDGVWWDKQGDSYSCQPWLADSVVDGYSALIDIHPETEHRTQLEQSFVQVAGFVDRHAFNREGGGIWQSLRKTGLAAGPYTSGRSLYGRGICGLSAFTMGKAYELSGDRHFLETGRELLALVEQSKGKLYHGKEMGQALHYLPYLIYYLDGGGHPGRPQMTPSDAGR